MYLKDKVSGDKVEITDMTALFDPFKSSVAGRFHAGEELQDEQQFTKRDLQFLSGETLPLCWLNANYQ